MATGKDLRRIALKLEGTAEVPHFDRRAFRVERQYVTLEVGETTANFKFTADEQQLKCLTAPDAFAPVPGGWGRMGWTTATLAHLSVAELKAALELSWAHARPKPKKKPEKKKPAKPK
jgi:hypothetical protein